MPANPSTSAQHTSATTTPAAVDELLARFDQSSSTDTSLQEVVIHLHLLITDLSETKLNPDQARRAVETVKRSIASVNASLTEGRYPEVSSDQREVISQVLALTDLGNLQGDGANAEVLGMFGKILAVAWPLIPTGQESDVLAPRLAAKETRPGSVTSQSSRTNQHGASADSSTSISFSPEAYAELERIARQKGKPVGAIVRDALALEKWFDETRGTGGRVLVERNGRLQELVKV